MHSPEIKQKAIQLRKGGKSIGDIAKVLAVSKSTISHWCRDLQLTDEAIAKISKRGKNKLLAALLRYSEGKRIERIGRTMQYKNEGKQMTSSLTKSDILMVGLGLYWGEGYKESNGELGFTNSNPDIVKFYIYWLSLFSVEKKDLIFRLTLNDFFKQSEKKLKKFWTKILDVNENQFSKTTIIQSKLKKASYNNQKTYKGILRIKVRKGLALKYKILGAIEHIALVHNSAS